MKLPCKVVALVLVSHAAAFAIRAQPRSAVEIPSASATAPLAPGEVISNLDLLKNKLKHYHDCTCTCGCYAKDLEMQANRAIAYLRKRTANGQRNQKYALVLDIDETTLSNYPEMLQAGFAYDANAFNAWVNSGQATAIPGTLRLVRKAEQKGVAVFFLTGRPEEQRAATEKNLRSQGFNAWQKLILRQSDQKSLTALQYKSAERSVIQAEGYRIILNVGDQ